MRIYLGLALVLTLFTSGCVSARLDEPEHAWPKPVVAANLKQFDGVYRDSALQILKTGKPAENTTELFVFVLGPKHNHEERGLHVEIRSAAGGGQFRIRLLDRKGRELESALLHRGTDYTFSDGAIVLLHTTGIGTTSTNWGYGVGHKRSRLRVTTNGSLIGEDVSGEVGLLMTVIPYAEAKRYFWFWPKEPK